MGAINFSLQTITSGSMFRPGEYVWFGQPNQIPDPDNPATLKNPYIDPELTTTANAIQGIDSYSKCEQSIDGRLYGSGTYSIRVMSKADNTGVQRYYLPEVDLLVTEEQLRREYVAQVATTDALRALEPEFDRQQASICGVMYFFDQSDTVSPDDGYGVLVTSGGARWVRCLATSDTVTFSIPSDYPSLQDAMNSLTLRMASPSTEIILNIESGHNLTSGINLRHGDWSRFKITSDDAVVYLSAGFVGADTSGVPAGILGEAPAAPLFLGYGAKMPKLACKIDMANLYGTGVQLAESEIVIDSGCGVINAGFRGIQIHGRANGYGSVWDGASGSGIRLQQASSGCFNGASADNCCSTADTSNSAVYVSRSSSLEFRYGHANNSGASGLISRRSKVTADNASFDGAAINGIYCESEGEVSFSQGSAVNCVSSSLRANANASIYAVGATISTTSSAKNLNIDVGSRITVADSTTIEGLTGLANAISESTVPYANAWSPAGVLIYDGETGTFETGIGTNGTYQKTADGRMTAWVNATIDVGTVASGGTSALITLPTLPVTFATVETAHMTVVGRTSTAGGGNRVGVINYWRGLTTGNEWRIVNSGIQLDGSSTGLSCLSIQVQMTIHGTY